MKLDWQKERIEKVSRIVNSFSNGEPIKILDVGCFDRYLETLLKKNVNYTGLDINDKADIQCDLNPGKLPLNGEKFDVIVCSEIFEHIINSRELLSEMKKHIKKGGIGIITLPNENHILIRFRRLLNRKYDNLVFSKNPQHHIHSPRIKDNFDFVKSEFKIIKYEHTSTSKISRLLMRISPSLFARGTLFVVK